MALIIPPGYAQAVIHWTGPRFESGRGATTFGFSGGLGPGPDVALAAAKNVEGAWLANVLPLQDGDLTMESVEVTTNTDAAVEPVGVNGGTNFASPPPNVACLVRKDVAGRGRRRQGRMFVPGILSAAVVNDAGFIDPGARAAIQTAFNDFLFEFTEAEQGVMVILQNTEGVTPPLQPPPVVLSLTVDGKVASQRRRLRR